MKNKKHFTGLLGALLALSTLAQSTNFPPMGGNGLLGEMGGNGSDNVSCGCLRKYQSGDKSDALCNSRVDALVNAQLQRMQNNNLNGSSPFPSTLNAGGQTQH